jgi:hypothetical protein
VRSGSTVPNASRPIRILSSLIAATFVLGIAAPVRAAIMYFSCPGTLLDYDRNGKFTNSNEWTVAVTFDADRQTVKITDFDPVQIEVSDDALDLRSPAITRADPYGLITLTLNRITGRLDFSSVYLGGREVFSGTCKLTNKLF